MRISRLFTSAFIDYKFILLFLKIHDFIKGSLTKQSNARANLITKKMFPFRVSLNGVKGKKVKSVNFM
jgi:hypothetical protein